MSVISIFLNSVLLGLSVAAPIGPINVEIDNSPQKNEKIRKIIWVDPRDAMQRSSYEDVRPVLEKALITLGVRRPPAAPQQPKPHQPPKPHQHQKPRQ